MTHMLKGQNQGGLGRIEMATRYARKENGERVAYRSAVNDSGERIWEEAPDEDQGIINKYMPINAKNPQNEQAIKNSMDQLKLKELRDQNVRDMSFGEQAMVAAGRESDKLLAGAANIYDFAADTLGSDDAVKRTADRATEQRGKDEMYQSFDDEANMIAKLGGASLPYLLTGVSGGPAMNKLGQGVVNKVKGALSGTGSKITSSAGNLGNKLAAKPGLVGEFGKKLKLEHTDPMVRNAMRKGRQPNTPDPYRTGRLGDIVGGAALGAAEGTLHHDNTLEGGLFEGVAGGLGGVLSKPFVNKTPNYYNDHQKELIEWGKDQGMKFLPGAEKGSRRQQIFEAGLRGDRSWTDRINRFDRDNQTVANKVALEQMGLDLPDATVASPEVLRGHLKDLKAQYQDLESKSIGRFAPGELSELTKTVGALKRDSKGAYNARTDKIAAKFLKKFKSLQTPSRGEDGKMLKESFNGKQYQKLRIELKNDIDSAYKAGDVNTRSALKPFMDALDGAMETGVREFGGEVDAKLWKELNEKYALTHLVMEKGMTPLGQFDPKKLGNHFATSDAKRYLTETGGKVVPLQRLSKLDTLTKRDTQGSGLTSDNLNMTGNPTKLSLFDRVLQTPASGMVPFLPDLYMKAYVKGWPSKTGLLNFDDKGLKRAGLYTGALAQGSQTHNKLLDKVMSMKDMFESIGEDD